MQLEDCSCHFKISEDCVFLKVFIQENQRKSWRVVIKHTSILRILKSWNTTCCSRNSETSRPISWGTGSTSAKKISKEPKSISRWPLDIHYPTLSRRDTQHSSMHSETWTMHFVLSVCLPHSLSIKRLSWRVRILSSATSFIKNGWHTALFLKLSRSHSTVLRVFIIKWRLWVKTSLGLLHSSLIRNCLLILITRSSALSTSSTLNFWDL